MCFVFVCLLGPFQFFKFIFPCILETNYGRITISLRGGKKNPIILKE
jgi:hypothetical protein